jgi:hypothetical protein
MRLRRPSRSARQRALVEGAVAAYTQSRSECAAVRNTYRRWVGASPAERRAAFDDYRSALNREAYAARSYAQLVRRAGHVPEMGLARQLAELEMSSRAQ